MLVGIVVVIAMERPVVLGPWATDPMLARVQERLAAQGVTARMGSAELVVRDGLVPALYAEDITLHRLNDPAPLVHLSRTAIQFHRQSLLVGQLRAKSVQLDGFQVDVTLSDAGLGLEVEQADLLDQVRDVGGFVVQVRDLLDLPGLAKLEELGLTSLGVTLQDRRRSWLWRSRDGDIHLTRRNGEMRMRARLAQLGETAAPGSVTLEVRSEDTTGAGDLRVAMRGLTPQQLVPAGAAPEKIAWLANADVPLSVELAADLLPNGDMGPLHGRMSTGSGRIGLPSGEPVAVESAVAALSVAHGFDQVRIRDLEVATDLVSAGGSALVLLAGKGEGPYVAQLSLHDVSLRAPEFFEKEVEAQFLEASFSFDPATRRIEIGATDLMVDDLHLHASGHIQPPFDTAQAALSKGRKSKQPSDRPKRPLPVGWSGAIDLHIPTADVPDAVRVWPKPLAPGTRRWVSNNVLEGSAHDFRMALRVPRQGRADNGMSFTLRDVKANVAPTLPPMTAAHAVLSVYDHQVHVMSDHALLPVPGQPDIDIRQIHVTKGDTTDKSAPLLLSGVATGSVTTALTFLQNSMFQPKDRDPPPPPFLPEEVAGAASLRLAMTLPMGPDRKGEPVLVDGVGEITDVASDALVRGRTVTADSIALALTHDGVSLSGPVALDGMGMDMSWQRALGSGASPDSTLAVSGPLTQPLVASFGVPFTPAQMQSPGVFEANFDLSPGVPPRIDLAGDLTDARIQVASLGWSKPIGQPASLRLTGKLGPTPVFDTLRIENRGLSTDGSLTLANGGLDVLRFDRLRLGQWFDGALAVRPAETNRVALEVTGGRLSLPNRPRPDTSDQPSPIGLTELRLDRITVSDTIALTDVRGAWDLADAPAGSITGRLNGGTPVSVVLEPIGSKTSRIRITGSNAGAAARDANIYAKAEGGDLDLRLTPTGPAGHYRGNLNIDDITVRDAPAAANVLSAISLVGIAEQAGSGGLVFGSVNADFKLTPEAIMISKSSASGPSLGLSMRGEMNLQKKSMDLSGVVSPFYFLNRIASPFTNRGEGVVGITFNLKGPFDG
ncbi:MAG: AsmA-like C-terminal region-containing protein, partial [Pseudomonadota bacterium]